MTQRRLIDYRDRDENFRCILGERCLFAVSTNSPSFRLVTRPYLRRSLGPYCRRYYCTNGGRSSTSTHRLELQCDRRNPWPESLTRELTPRERRNTRSCSDVIVPLFCKLDSMIELSSMDGHSTKCFLRSIGFFRNHYIVSNHARKTTNYSNKNWSFEQSSKNDNEHK